MYNNEFSTFKSMWKCALSHRGKVSIKYSAHSYSENMPSEEILMRGEKCGYFKRFFSDCENIFVFSVCDLYHSITHRS